MAGDGGGHGIAGLVARPRPPPLSLLSFSLFLFLSLLRFRRELNVYFDFSFFFFFTGLSWRQQSKRVVGGVMERSDPSIIALKILPHIHLNREETFNS